MIRLDMSEYMEKHAVARMIGAPPGYVGYEEGGQLTEAIRRRPYAVVLFDEIEKAHQDVFNVLLQILDDGRLTDAKGRTVDFKNTVLIMTSNLGSREIQESEGDEKEVREMVLQELRAHFKPEFLNRIDDIVIFHQLSREQIGQIIDVQLERLRGCSAKEISIGSLDDPARQLLGHTRRLRSGPWRARPKTRYSNAHPETSGSKTFGAETYVPGNIGGQDFADTLDFKTEAAAAGGRSYEGNVNGT